MRPLEHIHHQAGNLQIEVSARGSHAFGLQKIAEQWRIASFRFNIKFVDGNLDLENAP